MARAGAGAFLLEAFRGALEPHTPWSNNAREATMLLRGYAPDATQALADAGYGWLRSWTTASSRGSSPGWMCRRSTRTTWYRPA